MPTARPDSYVIASGADLYAGIAAPSPPPPPPPPPPPSPGITLTALGGLSTTVGSSLGFSAALANPASLPLVGTPEAVSGPALTPSPGTVTWSLGDLNKAFSATWAAAGTAVLRVRGADGTLSNSLSVTVAPAPSPTPPPPPPAPGTTLANLTLVGTDGAAKPFTAGLDFRQGDVPSANQVVLAGASVSAQFVVKNRWSDGSVKFGLASGRATISGGTATLAFSAGTQTLGASLDLTALQATGITASVDAGTFGAATWTNGDFASPFLAWVAGPEMSSWIYRKAVGSDPHLVAWLEVRVYANGEVSMLPWVENGFLTGTSCANKSATYVFSINGSSRFSAVLDIKHHQAPALISGSAVEHWVGTDPGILPIHDMDYRESTELVPPYRSTLAAGASEATRLPTAHTPLAAGVYEYSSDSMQSSGYQRPIGLLPMHEAVAQTAASADQVQAVRAVIQGGYSARRYGITRRDATTNRVPRLTAYPTLVLDSASSSVKDTGASTTSTYGQASTGGEPPTWDTAHCPSVGYLAYLTTGHWFHLETAQFAHATNHFNVTDWLRGAGRSGAPLSGYTGASGVCVTAVQTRSGAWWFRSLAQALAITPDADSSGVRTDLIAAMQANCLYWSTYYSNAANNDFGIIEPSSNESYGDGYGRVSMFQQDFYTAVLGWAKSMKLPISSTAQTQMDAFFDWKAQSVVGRLGASGSGFAFENANAYTVRISSSAFGNTDPYFAGTGPWAADWGEVYTLTNTPAPSPDYRSSTANLLGLDYNTAIDSVRGLWGNLLPALSYAVRHGVSGASAAYTRLQAASNWGLLETQFASIPVWGAKPLLDPAAPAWLSGVAVNQWVQISGTTGSGAALNAWGTLVLIDGTATLVSPANGGHTDSSDNRVASIDLTQNSPTWTQQIAPSSSVTANADYMPDGKPVSRHGYHHAHYISQRSRVMLFGARGWYSNGGDGYKVDGHSVSGTWAWDAAGTYSDLASGRGFGVCRDPLTGNVWTNGGWLWTQSSNTWSQPGTQQIAGSGIRWPVAFDTARSQFFALQWADGQGLSGSGILARVINRTTGALTTITFSAGSASAVAQFTSDAPVYAGMDYDQTNDCFLFYEGLGVPGRVYRIRPNGTTTWDMDILTTTGTVPGAAVAAVNGRWKFIPQLGGFAVLPSQTSNFWFLRTI